MKKVSVIIPCYNAAKWLPKCFLSLVNQTIGIGQIELIFVDDASNDDGATWSMLQEFEKAYPDSIMVIHLEQNMRQGGARNIALAYASGEYVAFVDADDFVAENFLEEVYQKANTSDAEIVQFGYWYYTDQVGAVEAKQRVKAQSIQIESIEQRKQFLIDEIITYGCWNKLYKKEMIQKAGVRYAEHVIYEEPLFVYPLLFYVNRVEIIDKPYYYYRQNEAGTMRNDMKQVKTLKMHADVQFAVWNFMKATPFFQIFYEEIKLYFLHTFYFETVLFAKQRGLEVPIELKSWMEKIIKTEVREYQHSEYAEMIPKQMELYKKI